MVKLKRPTMGIYKDIFVEMEGLLGAEAHVAVMKTAIVIISDMAPYDGIFYINACDIKELPHDQISICGNNRYMKLKFGTAADKIDFLFKAGASSGLIAPAPSPVSKSPP